MNIEFFLIHGDILDKKFLILFFILKDADVVHHLAGITDVPRVKSQSNNDNDEKIKNII